MFRRKKDAKPTKVVTVVMAEEVDHTKTVTPPPLPPKKRTPEEKVEQAIKAAISVALRDPDVLKLALKQGLVVDLDFRTEGIPVLGRCLIANPQAYVSTAGAFLEGERKTEADAPKPPVAAAPVIAPPIPPKPRVNPRNAEASQANEARLLAKQSNCFFWWCRRRPNKPEDVKVPAPTP